jgi:deazaflavin-dependent oxidoreductase (nitroreductase family)
LERNVNAFSQEVIDAAKREREVTFTTYGRKTGQPSIVTIFVVTHGDRLFIKSGQGMVRQWPQNLVARGEGVLHLGNTEVKVKPRHVTDPAEARMASELYESKYGSKFKGSQPDEALTPGEQATFELIPSGS